MNEKVIPRSVGRIVAFIPNNFWHTGYDIITEFFAERIAKSLRKRKRCILSVARALLKRYDTVTRFIGKYRGRGFTEFFAKCAFICLMRNFDEFVYRLRIERIEIGKAVIPTRFGRKQNVCVPLSALRGFVFRYQPVFFQFPVPVERYIVSGEEFGIALIRFVFQRHLARRCQRKHN